MSMSKKAWARYVNKFTANEKVDLTVYCRKKRCGEILTADHKQSKLIVCYKCGDR